MSESKPKFYVVWEGREPGIYSAWADAERQVKGHPGAKFKSFPTRHEAEAALRGSYRDYTGQSSKQPRASSAGLDRAEVVLDSLAVDAACSGVPGPMEYRGVHVGTGEQVFHLGPYPDGTNNIGEFLAIIHALEILKEEGKPDMPIYSDSYNARKWISEKVCRTNLAPTFRNGPIFELIDDALRWLKAHAVTNPILTWETRLWGENPADFGRK